MKYVTRPDVFVGFRGGRCIFGSGSRQKSFTDSCFYLPLLHATAVWKSPQTVNEVKAKLLTLGLEIKYVENALDYLLQSKYVGVFSEQRDHRYSRHSLYYSSWNLDPEPIQRRIRKSSVAILGCGGIGNHVSLGVLGSTQPR